jgi:hypothetical protein
MVNGVEQDISPEEEAAICAEWSANAALPVEVQKDPVDKLKAFLANNPDVRELITQA